MSKELTEKSHNMTENEQKIGKNTQYEQKKCLSLTEQWRNGTLPKGWYYVETPCEEIKKLYCGDGESIELEDPETSAYYFYHKKYDKSKIDILGVVPDYMDCKGLMYDSIALNKTRKRIDELESKLSAISEQLAEANEVIGFYANTDGLTEEEKQMTAEKYHLVYGLKANDYLTKYGVEK